MSKNNGPRRWSQAKFQRAFKAYPGTQTELAKMVGVSTPAVLHWRKGAVPRAGTQHKIAAAMGVSMTDLTVAL